MALAFAKRAFALALAASVAGSALAEPVLQGRPSSSGPAARQAVLNVGLVNPSFRFQNSSIGTGAVGLRNRPDGGIEISGVTAPIKRAFIYWAAITQGAPTAATSNINIKRGAANGPFTNIPGVAVGTGASPCWAGDRITVFRGIIPSAVATGNALYLIQLRPGANANVSGASPWESSAPPMVEGASIVLVGAGNADISVYDQPLAGKTFFDQLNYQLRTPVSIASSSEILLHNIGADGQSGVGVNLIAATAGEITTLNGRRVAGPGSATPSDWNGGVASPLPQLWDATTNNVTVAAKAGAAQTLSFNIRAPDDCLTPVANVLSIR